MLSIDVLLLLSDTAESDRVPCALCLGVRLELCGASVEPELAVKQFTFPGHRFVQLLGHWKILQQLWSLQNLGMDSLSHLNQILSLYFPPLQHSLLGYLSEHWMVL